MKQLGSGDQYLFDIDMLYISSGDQISVLLTVVLTKMVDLSLNESFTNRNW